MNQICYVVRASLNAATSSVHASLFVHSMLTIEAGTCRLSFGYSVAVRQGLTGAEHWHSKPQSIAAHALIAIIVSYIVFVSAS